MQKTQTLKVQNPTVLPITSKELEDFLRDIEGAEIVRPIQTDPIAVKDDEVVGFWTE